jgi:single-stranded-DNA-specific exonuclease
MYIYKPVNSALNRDEIQALSDKMNISPLLAQLLWQRGITDEISAAEFLHPSLSQLHDPYALPDMETAVHCIKAAVQDSVKIAVYGDYDVDGITSSAIMLSILHDMGADAIPYLPDRFSEGYGLNSDAVYKLHEQGIGLIITVDCGITAVEEIKLARELGMQVVVTDHHHCSDKLPDAQAVVNPHRPDATYPFASLAGVGVAFKLACALIGLDAAMDYIDIAALGTVADIVPLVGENRVIVKYGLQRIKDNPRLGIKALWQAAGLKDDISCINTEHIAFQLAPRLNAAGRMSSAIKGLKLLMSQDTDETAALAKDLDADNRRRQSIERQIIQEAIGMIDDTVDLRRDFAIVLAKEGWHQGVIGIAAGKLAEMYHRPVLMIALSDGIGHGSARSIPSLDLYQTLIQCRKYFVAFGGHAQAAGFSILEEDVNALRRKLNDVLSDVLSPQDVMPLIYYDADINIEDISPATLDELSLLEPFGDANEEPVFLIGAAPFKDMREVGADKAHLKLCLTQGGADLDCIAFRNGNKYQELCCCQRLDVIGSLELNTWNGVQKVQLKAAHIRPSIDKRNLDAFICQYYDNITDGFIADNVEISGDASSIDDILESNAHTEQRDQWLIEHISDNINNLILVNTQGQLAHLLHILRENKTLEIMDMHYNSAGNDSVVYNRILVNAELSTLNLKPFTHVILYDVPFSASYILKLADEITDQELHIIFGADQLKDNIEMLKQWTLSRGDMEGLYKALRYAARRSAQYNIKADLLIEAAGITAHKLIKGLDIFQQLSLLRYSMLPDGMVYICMLPYSRKMNLRDNAIYSAMERLQKAFKDFEKYVKIKYN